jgi:hypothetical protein
MPRAFQSQLVKLLAVLITFSLASAEDRGHQLAHDLYAAGLDPAECYRVNDLRISREDLRVYFNHGYLIFSKPVNGVRPGALFSAAEEDGGDGEALILPPNRAERLSLFRFTGAPNLDAHFSSALVIFSDNTSEELLREIERNAAGEPPRKDPVMGAKLAGQLPLTLATVYETYEIPLVHDLLSPPGPDGGFFVLVAAGPKVGGFETIYEPAPDAQIIVGQPVQRQGRQYFNVWTSFPAHSVRQAKAPKPPDIAVEKFKIEASFDKYLAMTVTSSLRFTARERISGAIPFSISSRMHITSAELDGQPAEVLQSSRSDDGAPPGAISGENEIFLLIPSRPVEQGGHEIVFRHEGAVVTETADHVYYVGSRGTWYPQYGTDPADFDLTFRYPKGLGLVSTGNVVEDRADGPQRVTRTVTSAPIRFAGFNLGDYERVKVTRGPYTIEVCANRRMLPAPASEVALGTNTGHPPRPTATPDTKDRMQTLAFETASAFSFMATLLGPPRITTMIVSPIPGTFGQGFPGLIYLSTLAYLHPSQRPLQLQTRYDQTFFSEILEAHEIAHQWWGNLVTPASGEDNWLMEALANYSALYYLEKRKGKQAVSEVLQDYKTDLLASDANGRSIESSGPIIWGLRLQTSDTPEGWRVITYEKGSWIIHMLRRRLGDERFFELLRVACERYKNTPMSTENFRALASELMPRDVPDASLESFFENWVYGTGIPTLKVTSSVHGLRLTGSLSQSGVAPDFTPWVPIAIHDGLGEQRIRWVQTGADASEFSVAVKHPTARADLIPDWLYK